MPSSDVCGQCSAGFKDKSGRFVSSIVCAVCKARYHVKCAKVDARRANDSSWECLRCVGKGAAGSNSSRRSMIMLRSKSTSDSAAPEDVAPKATPKVTPGVAVSASLLNKLTGIADELGSVKKAAQQMGNTLPDSKMIIAKVNDLMEEVQDVRQLIREQDDKIKEIVENQMRLESDNAKIKSEIKAVKISHELHKQEQLDGKIILSGLPLKEDIDPERIVKNLCNKLAIQYNPMDVKNARLDLINVRNKSVAQQMLYIAAPGSSITNEITRKYKEAKKQKKYITAADLVEGADKKPIYVNNELTGYFQLIYKKARDLRRNGMIKFVWEEEGRILIRKGERREDKILRLKHLDDLNEFYVQ